MPERCGFTIVDADGIEQPCDRPATGHRWYQDCGEHEDLLDVACDWHSNEGGRRIHDAEAKLAAILAEYPDIALSLMFDEHSEGATA